MRGSGIRQFRDLMRQAVRIAPRTGLDSYGKATYGQAQTYRARVVGKTRLVRSITGQEVVSSHTVYLAAAPEIQPTDKVTLPEGYDPQEPPIVSIGRYPDEHGPHHTVLFLQ